MSVEIIVQLNKLYLSNGEKINKYKCDNFGNFDQVVKIKINPSECPRTQSKNHFIHCKLKSEESHLLLLTFRQTKCQQYFMKLNVFL